jgi:hypothetical protein
VCGKVYDELRRAEWCEKRIHRKTDMKSIFTNEMVWEIGDYILEIDAHWERDKSAMRISRICGTNINHHDIRPDLVSLTDDDILIDTIGYDHETYPLLILLPKWFVDTLNNTIKKDGGKSE